jgi:hypothetical protein
MRRFAERVADLVSRVANDHDLPVRSQAALDGLDHTADAGPATDIHEQFHAAVEARAASRRRDDDQCPICFCRLKFHFARADELSRPFCGRCDGA